MKPIYIYFSKYIFIYIYFSFLLPPFFFLPSFFPFFLSFSLSFFILTYK